MIGEGTFSGAEPRHNVPACPAEQSERCVKSERAAFIDVATVRATSASASFAPLPFHR